MVFGFSLAVAGAGAGTERKSSSCQGDRLVGSKKLGVEWASPALAEKVSDAKRWFWDLHGFRVMRPRIRKPFVGASECTCV